MKTFRSLVTLFGCAFFFFSVGSLAAQDSGLLFYLSGEQGLTADWAGGNAFPNYCNNVETIEDGAQGRAVRERDQQILSYWAPGNIRAQRGTLAFYWRAATPFTETEFPIFRVGYSDHSSWDMVFLRMDYNGHGFDAFVTDVNLARIRTSVTVERLPEPEQWTHFALSWDENEGIRFYLDGRLVGRRDTTVVLDAGLDQFGPHARIISPYQVQSAYNFQRGGDIDELRIYDQALEPEAIRQLAQGEVPQVAPLRRSVAEAKYDREWRLRYGWNRAGDLPPYLEKRETAVRKVQVLETYDLKRWYWKANDGIRETTWPGVYNRSRIIGRNDYFQLPDWDCYSLSGQQVHFRMPDEPWNHIEFSGGADGEIAVQFKGRAAPVDYFSRAAGNERTTHRTEKAIRGEEIVFTNRVQETPIGEFDTYYVHDGTAPQGIARLEYLFSGAGNAENPNVTEILGYIRGRYPADERTVMVANPARIGQRGQRGQAAETTAVAPVAKSGDTMPLVHLVIPSDFRSTGISSMLDVSRMPQYLSYTWHAMHGGLDGVRVTIPALDVEPLADGLFPLNIRVMDPIWPLRRMADFSFSVRPGEERVLWIDLRDRILPDGKPLYLTLAGAQGLDAGKLAGMRVELIFKPWDEAKAEHIADRFTQVRDNYAMICEERPNNRRLNKYTQFESDLTDLLRIEPNHRQGREYWYIYNNEQPRPAVEIEPAKAGVPAWAHLQLKYLGQYRSWAEWVIDNRQIDNGEFGGGLSDDSDFGNWMPPLAAMGVMPEKIDESVGRMMEAIYDNDMLEGGMSKIQSDGLHTFEEGTNVIGQMNLLRVGDPKQAGRLMEAAHSVRHHLLGVDRAGHTHFRSDYFSRTKRADKGVWAWSSARQSLHLIPAIYLAEMYGHQAAKRDVIAMADGFLAHATVAPDGRVTVDSEINFERDESRPSGMGNSSPLFWAAWRWTGNQKYLKPLVSHGIGGMSAVTSNMLDIAGLRAWAKEMGSRGRDSFTLHLNWQLTGDKSHLEQLYTELVAEAAVRHYVNTQGYVWTDRMVFDIETIQRARLGGIVQTRSMFYPGHAVSWRFDNDRGAEQVAILLPRSTPQELHVELFNTSDRPVTARMTGWDVLNGRWDVEQGIDTDGDGVADGETSRRTVAFGREESVALELAPMQSTIVRMTLKGRGVRITERPDLAIGRDDVQHEGGRLTVTVHNLGGVAAKETEVVLRDASGRQIGRADVPALPGADDLLPKCAQVGIDLPAGTDLEGCTVAIDPDGKLMEIRKSNNVYKF